MRELFSMNEKDLDPSWSVVTRPSVRGIIIQDDKVLMIYSKKYKYYKFPGGGVEDGEKHTETLVREVLEESGYRVLEASIKEYGEVTRRQKDTYAENSIFEQKNYYYICDVDSNITNQNLDTYEEQEGFEPVWINPLQAFNYNRKTNHGEADKVMIKRETMVLDTVDKYVRKENRKKKEQAWIESLGQPYYKEMLAFVEAHLNTANDGFMERKGMVYDRFEHTKRVLAWAVRLYNESMVKEEIDYDKVIIATIFHDIGKKEETATISHAEAGEKITRKYLQEKGYSKERTEEICYLIAKHSDKDMMNDDDISPELLLLMEADLMDDMGAMGIMIDCMIEGAAIATFTDAFDHISRYTLRQHEKNPMVTEKARKIWDEKTQLVRSYHASLERDLEIFR